MNDDKIVEHGKLTFIGKIVIPLAIKYRNNLVLKNIKNRDSSLLDIGGGKGYLVRNTRCKNSISLDEQGSLEIIKNKDGKIISKKKLNPIKINNSLDFQDEKFNYVTMVAVIEHLKNPGEITREIHRILKPNGLLIITTPFPIVEKILYFLDRGSDQLRGKSVEEEHENYFNLKSMNKLTKHFFRLKKYKKFQLGVNQLFVYQKI